LCLQARDHRVREDLRLRFESLELLDLPRCPRPLGAPVSVPDLLETLLGHPRPMEALDDRRELQRLLIGHSAADPALVQLVPDPARQPDEVVDLMQHPCEDLTRDCATGETGYHKPSLI
jgi:hypothetical protein